MENRRGFLFFTFSAQQRTPVSSPRRSPDRISSPPLSTAANTHQPQWLVYPQQQDERWALFRTAARHHHTLNGIHYNNNMEITISHRNETNFPISTLTLSEAHLLCGSVTNPSNHSSLPFSSAGQQPCNSHLPSRGSCWCCHLYTMFASYRRIVRGPWAGRSKY